MKRFLLAGTSLLLLVLNLNTALAQNKASPKQTPISLARAKEILEKGSATVNRFHARYEATKYGTVKAKLSVRYNRPGQLRLDAEIVDPKLKSINILDGSVTYLTRDSKNIGRYDNKDLWKKSAMIDQEIESWTKAVNIKERKQRVCFVAGYFFDKTAVQFQAASQLLINSTQCFGFAVPDSADDWDIFENKDYVLFLQSPDKNNWILFQIRKKDAVLDCCQVNFEGKPYSRIELKSLEIPKDKIPASIFALNGPYHPELSRYCEDIQKFLAISLSFSELVRAYFELTHDHTQPKAWIRSRGKAQAAYSKMLELGLKERLKADVGQSIRRVWHQMTKDGLEEASKEKAIRAGHRDAVSSTILKYCGRYGIADQNLMSLARAELEKLGKDEKKVAHLKTQFRQLQLGLTAGLQGLRKEIEKPLLEETLKELKKP
jgi:hypothetical protein